MSVTGDHRFLGNKAVIYGDLLTCDAYAVHSLAARDPSSIPVLSTVTSFCLKDFSWPDAQTRCTSVNIEVVSLDVRTHVYIGQGRIYVHVMLVIATVNWSRHGMKDYNYACDTFTVTDPEFPRREGEQP